MKTFFAFLVSLILSSGINAQELNVMSFNIRYNNPGDSLNAWPYRIDKVNSQISFHKAHLVGVQEALVGQLRDMIKGLPGFRYVGVGRADGKEKGEFSAIFYDTSRLQALESNTFWLAEKTDDPGKKGWDASFERVVTWARFKDQKTGKIFYHFNTHFDHMGKVARKESAKLLLRKISEIAGDVPAIITGDFNAQPHDEPIQVLVDSNNNEKLTDTRLVSETPHYGPSGTFNAFGPKEIHEQPIDYIFIKKGFRVLQHASISQTWEGRFSSDHFPVMVVLVQESQ
ncbi:MAG: endonuclease/exonuclease/phosphatase family protein [Flavisolibacter sp.]